MATEPEPQPDAPEDDTETPPEGETEPFDADRAKAKITKANNEAAALRKRLKDAEAKAAKLDELEDASKTETQRQTEALAALERRATEAESKALRLEVAADKGLTPKQAARLVGSSREELEADADELLADFKPSEEEPAPRGRPREALRPGAVPNGEPADPSSPRELVKDVPRI